MKKLVFYNSCQNGDNHVSRTYIADFVRKTKGYEVYYAHKQSISQVDFLLADIDGLKKEVIDEQKLYDIRNETIFEENDVVYINTWYGQKEFAYFRQVNATNCNFHILYAIFTDVYAHFGLVLEEFSYYLPKINYKNVEIDRELIYKGQRFGKTVLLCSNDVVSGQAPNFSFDPIARKLATNFRDVLFFSTEDTIRNYENLINIKKLNLNQISYLSLVSDIIVGRGSGAYTFSITHENVFNRYKTFVCFTTDPVIALGLNEGEYKAKLVWSNDFTEENVYQKIANEI